MCVHIQYFAVMFALAMSLISMSCISILLNTWAPVKISFRLLSRSPAKQLQLQLLSLPSECYQ